MREFWRRGGAWVLGQVALIGVVVLVWRFWPREWLAYPREWRAVLPFVGMGVALASAILMLSGLGALWSYLTPLPAPTENNELVVSGAYRFVRHPIYGAVILGMIAIACLMSSAVGWALVAPTVVFFDRKARHEEAWLMARHPSYAEYRKRIKRLIPWVW